MALRVGSKVSWAWGTGGGEGTIKEIFYEAVSRTLKSAEVKRNGSRKDPAYLIRQKDGDEVLKLRSELTQKSKDK